MNNTNISINNKYIIENLIGKGKFGQIFKGHIYKKNTHIAIKMEPSEGEFKSIKHEVTILNYLYKRGCRNIPYIYWYGKYNLDICMVMNYFQGSLYRENIPQIDIFMIKCIDILKNIHEHYVIHRDIKPQNFMFDEHGELHLIDFGLATVYVDDNHRHIECTGCSQSYILGTPKYISFNVHEGYVPSRRDDLISVGYLYLFLKYGSLPWDNIGLFVSGSNDVGRSPESFVSFPPTSPSFTSGNIPNSQEKVVPVMTTLGTIAANLAEVHPLIMAECMMKWNYFIDFSIQQLIGFFSCFTDIRILKEFRRSGPSEKDPLLKEKLEEIQRMYTDYDKMEVAHDLRTGINYENAIVYDISDETMAWCSCENEEQCKLFIQTQLFDKEISVGDFTKSILKISIIAKEMMNVCEMIGHIELLHKLSQIDMMILKYITVNQSLYV